MADDDLNPFTGKARGALPELAESPPDSLEPGTASSPGPKKRGRPAGSTNRTNTTAKATLDAAKGMLDVCNIGLSFISPDDVLIDEERDKLAQALVDDTFTGKYIGKTAAGTAHIQLTIVLVQLAIPRMARHGMLPETMLQAPPSVPPAEPQYASALPQ